MASLGAGCNGGRKLAIDPSKPMVLYEGLPHQMYEPELLETERKEKPTVELGGFPFYRDPLPLKEGDAAKLADLLNDPKLFVPFTGEKKCGGFHPDYAVEWSTVKESHRILLCFGCGEARIADASGDERVDMKYEARKRLQEFLSAYRVNRPISVR